MHANSQPSSANRTRYYVESTTAHPLPIAKLGHFTADIYCLHKWVIASPRPELGSTFFSANCDCSHACKSTITGPL